MKNDTLQFPFDSENARKTIEIEIHRIGDQLISQVDWLQSMPWETLKINIDGSTEGVRTDYTLYSGNCGIVLFLLELWNYSKEQKYYLVASDAFQRIYQYYNSTIPDSSGLYTGGLGIAFLALRFYQVTLQEEFLQVALKLSKEYQNKLHNPSNIDECDILSGKSGALLFFLQLHTTYQNDWILDIINNLISILLEQSIIFRHGLCWEKRQHRIHPLCGFSHGAAGIGYAFLETAQYFNNPSLYFIAEQAFLYEEQYFSAEFSNWADLRRDIFTDKTRKESLQHYQKNNLDFFRQEVYVNAWCNGAVGIGLTRLKANQVINNECYLKQALEAIKCTRETISSNQIAPSFTLCHGNGGNAELFLEAYNCLNNSDYFEFAEEVAFNAIKQYSKENIYISGNALNKKNDDKSLFNGIAGIGYFFLRLLNPHEIPSILLPSLSRNKYYYLSEKQRNNFPFISINHSELQSQLLSKRFIRTLSFIKEVSQDETNNFLNQDMDFSTNQELLFKEFIQNTLPRLTLLTQDRLQEVFHLECKKIELNDNVESDLYMALQEKIEYEQSQKLIELPDKEFCELTIIKNKNVALYETRWKWSIFENKENWIDNLNNDPSCYHILLHSTFNGVLELEINHFQEILLKTFEDCTKISKALLVITEQFEYESENDIIEIHKIIIRQIKENLLSGMLSVAQLNS